ncbi:hypothetical protein N7468_004658 [Penicillium chermesinum]|uniref:PhoD2 n=2 Tax=Eurotiales TaxID=5042 RepID=A0A7M4CBU6_BYSSP|nr:uncharacterized protein N7468_004658 [Penicillium chermesinum]KAJ5240039.1 hypothetical protein N7468_004658 [Penicillium chermesinum]KAJ6166917.1 hypothetical protein N7470_002364 [Penicillium chermesinum]QOD95017.1 PhoD2 [Paecilomyces variotii]
MKNFFSISPGISLPLSPPDAVYSYRAASNTVTTTTPSAANHLLATCSTFTSVLVSENYKCTWQGDIHSPTGPLADLSYLKMRCLQGERSRYSKSEVKLLPEQYNSTEPSDLVRLISSMLMELVQINDRTSLPQGQQTRFHSRSPPQISVHDYLQRLTTHAKLPPAILLTIVYYLDRLCALYPAFTVSNLSIHRFLIVSATVASKGLSDQFWTNKTYARIGGISTTELAMLELEFLFKVNWQIVPDPQVLVDYYQHLVDRYEGFKIVDQSF